MRVRSCWVWRLCRRLSDPLSQWCSNYIVNVIERKRNIPGYRPISFRSKKGKQIPQANLGSPIDYRP